MPPLAASRSPRWSRVAPVNAPRAWPNSSLSTSPSANAAQLTRINGPLARGDARWTYSASISLPVPVSPTMSVLIVPRASRAASSYRRRIAGARTIGVRPVAASSPDGRAELSPAAGSARTSCTTKVRSPTPIASFATTSIGTPAGIRPARRVVPLVPP